MRCWRCGQDVPDDSSVCVACGASLARVAPTSDAGCAMREIYDRYGADAVLTDPAYLGNGLGDLLPDSAMLRFRLRMAIDADAGRLYLEQVRGAGAPDAAFGRRVRTLLVDGAGLSDAAASDIESLFDEMVGWKVAPVEVPPSPEPPAYGRTDEVRPLGAVRAVEPAGTWIPPTEMPSSAPQTSVSQPPQMGGLMRGLCVVGAILCLLNAVNLSSNVASALALVSSFGVSLSADVLVSFLSYVFFIVISVFFGITLLRIARRGTLR